LIFEGVDHFQVVFTLPTELSRLALGNRKKIYNLLFASAWKAIKQTMADEHGIDAAAAMLTCMRSSPVAGQRSMDRSCESLAVPMMKIQSASI
jgi:hypothetical protein